MIETFLVRAVAAGLGLAVVAAPLGCFVVWGRLAYFGETIAQASLIGVAVALAFSVDVTLAVLAVAVAVALVLIALGRQTVLPLDSVLGLMAHAALAVGILLASLARGPSLDLMGYLFGDIFAVTAGDLAWVAGGGALVLLLLVRLWQPLLALAVHEEIAAAEGVDRDRAKAAFVLMLAIVVAIAIKIVGALLIIAFLIMPAAAARPFVATPERMAVLSSAIAAAAVVLGLWLSFAADLPGGPSIVAVLAAAAAASLARAGVRRRA
jgi:zinc transport system permease protein